MNRIQNITVVGTLAAMCLVGASTAHAQTGTDITTPRDTSMTAKQHRGPVVCLASDLIGTKVVSPSGENLGKVEDVVIQPNGDIAYGVLSFGGTLGMGDKLFALPWSVLQPRTTDATGKDLNDRTIVLSIEKDRLKAAPGFDKAHWPSLANADWSRDVDTYYASYRRADKARPMESSARTNGSNTGIWRSSELKGFNVETPGNDKLGDIKDVAIDTNGRVSYAVVSVGGFLGIGDRLVAVPWDALRVTREGDKGDKKRITLATTKERLEQAPQFNDDKDKRAEMVDPLWVGRVYEYYSVRPYWSDMDDGMNRRTDDTNRRDDDKNKKDKDRDH